MVTQIIPSQYVNIGVIHAHKLFRIDVNGNMYPKRMV